MCSKPTLTDLFYKCEIDIRFVNTVESNFITQFGHDLNTLFNKKHENLDRVEFIRIKFGFTTVLNIDQVRERLEISNKE